MSSEQIGLGAADKGYTDRLYRRGGARRSLLSRGPVFVIVFAAALLVAAAAQAHPHVWVTVRTELVFDANGAATAVRHAWTFDDMYSAFAVQGLDAKTQGQFTREELQSLAQVNAESLKEYDFFTYARVNGKRQREAFADVVDYWLDYDPKEQVLTLHFTVPFKVPVKAKTLAIDIYDPEFFIDFGFAERDPVKLVSAPSQCTVATQKPNDVNFPAALRLDQSLMASEANAGMGMNFANKLSVKCP